MKIWAWTAAVGSVVALVACGGGGTGSTGGGGAGGTSTSSSSTMTTVSSSSGSTMTTSSSGTGGTTGCGSFLYSTDATCVGCVETSCCAELLGCDSGTACEMLSTCFDNCAGDMACQMQCQTDHSDGVADVQLLVACADASCKMECTTPGTICDSGLVNNANPECGTCSGEQCCAEFTACVADATCNDCITGGTTGCDTSTLLDAVFTCTSSKCADTCGAQICDSGLTIKNAACASCLGTKCCDVLNTCVGNMACLDNCLTTPTPAANCATNMDYQAVKTCWNTNCAGAADCGNML